MLRQSRSVLFLLVFSVLTLMLPPGRARAANGVVGSGSAASCTEQAFDTALAAANVPGGGTITFQCGAAPATIIFSYRKQIANPVTLQGANLITLSGNNVTGLFQVFASGSLTLNQIILTRAYAAEGAVENFGTLTIINSQVTNSTSSANGGAISSYGTLSLNTAVISGNTATNGVNNVTSYGGGLFLDGGTTMITASQVNNNTAKSAGGGIYLNSGTLTISNTSFAGNYGTDVYAQGGAIASLGSLTISQGTFTQNHSSRGGAISVLGGTANVSSTTFTGNYSAYGGGIRQEGGALMLNDAAFDRNGYAPNGSTVNTGGGAISFYTSSLNVTATISRVTMSNNFASYGGGFDFTIGTPGQSLTVDMTNVTISGNRAVGSSAFDMSQNSGTLSLTNATIANNAAPFFGAVGNRGGTLNLKNVILVGNYNPDNGQSKNCNAAVPGATFSISSDFTCGFGAGKDNINAQTGPLSDNGGIGKTHLLAKSSPAIDAGAGAGCPATDQRGIARPQGAACDMGAVEMRAQDVFFRSYLPFVMK